MWMHHRFYMSYLKVDTRYERYEFFCFSTTMQKKNRKRHKLQLIGKWKECSSCGSLDHDTHCSLWEMHFPAVSLFQAVPWHFKCAFTSSFNGPAPIFACLLSPKATKEEGEEMGGKKSAVFTPAKAVSKYVLHLCTLLGPPIPLIPRSSRLLEGRMIEGRYPSLLSCKRRSASLHSQKHQQQRCSKRGGKHRGGMWRVTYSPRAQWAMHRLDARVWKVIICRPKGM